MKSEKELKTFLKDLKAEGCSGWSRSVRTKDRLWSFKEEFVPDLIAMLEWVLN